MEGIIKISLVPTYLDTSPDAIVDTMILGTPNGNNLIHGVTREVPPVPPKARTASNSFSAYNFGIKAQSPLDITSMAYPRSFFSCNSATLPPPKTATES